MHRAALDYLAEWRDGRRRKPLVLRGARQVGKTTLVKIFSDSYDQYIYLNLDIENNRRLFEIHKDVKSLFEAVCLQTKKTPVKGNTLLFIDEIQSSPEAVAMLRYFYEELPWLDVIAAGSMLETLIGKRISFPVGRVEYLPVRPCSFPEFLLATGEQRSYELLQTVPVPDFVQEHLIQQFRLFAIMGGMPEIVEKYREEQSLAGLGSVYDGLIVSYLDDIEKYAKSQTMIEIIRHTISHSFDAAGSHITFSGFGNSNYKNREIGEAFRTLEKAFLFQLIYPFTGTRMPVTPNLRRSSKLQLVDTGLVNYMAGIQSELYNSADLNDTYRGRIAEHITGQELLCLSESVLFKLNYWTRPEYASSAEVDFIWPYREFLVPIEVKSGTAGKLRSLHQFINRAPHGYAVRVYSGKFNIISTRTVSGKPYKLMNLPFYLVNKLHEYLNLLIQDKY